VAVDAEVHDHLMALVSHLPHIIASALIRQAADTAPQGREALRSAGPSFRDITRVAGANPALWADILLSNRDAVLAETRRHRAELADVEEALRGGDRSWLEAFFARAAEGRERLMATDQASGGESTRVVIEVPNRPGVLSEIATALGHAHINIEDLNLVPAVAGEPAGTLTIVVDGEVSARKATELVGEREHVACPAGPVEKQVRVVAGDGVRAEGAAPLAGRRGRVDVVAFEESGRRVTQLGQAQVFRKRNLHLVWPFDVRLRGRGRGWWSRGATLQLVGRPVRGENLI
jgi:hypothetical protein